MSTLIIRKKSLKTWLHTDSILGDFIISKFYFNADNGNFQVVEQGQSKRVIYDVSDITLYDDTDGGVAETFANITALSLRLEELNYPAFQYDGQIVSIANLIDAGTNVTITGDGTEASPYVISATGGGGGGAVDSVNSQTGVVSIDLQSVVDEGRTFTESDGTTQYDFETFTGSGVSKVFRAIVTTVASGLQSILSFSRNAFTLRVRNSINPATFNEITASGGNFDFVTQNGTTARNTLRIPTKSIAGDAIYTFKSDRLAGTYNLNIESIAVSVDTTAIDNTNYIAGNPSTNITFTDPAPLGSFYTVLVRNSGTATVGGVAYPSGTYLIRHRTIDPSSQWNTMVLNNAIPQTVSFTAINDLEYTANGTLTVTDPTPIANKGFIVHVIGGSVTIGGVAYTSGALVYRYYNGTSWISTNMNASTLQDLQSVLNEGNIATDSTIELYNSINDLSNFINSQEIAIENSSTNDYSYLNINALSLRNEALASTISVQHDKVIKIKGDFSTSLTFTDTTANRVVTFKDESGTVALISDVENTQTNYTNNFLLGGM